MLAELAGQQLLVDLGTIAGAVLAVCALVAAATRTRPFRWLWRHLITNPVGEWFGDIVDRQLADIRGQFVNNGGSTQKDQLDRIEQRTERLEEAQVQMGDSLHVIRTECRVEADERSARQSELDERLSEVEAGLGRFLPILDEWQESHPEVRRHGGLDDDGGQT